MIRQWNRETDTGAIHVFGDGHTIAYGFGPEIIQVLAYPISADSFFKLEIPSAKECLCERMDKTAIWTHKLPCGAHITDLIDNETHCFRRQVETSAPLTMILTVEKVFSFVEDASNDDLWAFEAKDGVNFYIYPVKTIHPRRYLRFVGDVSVEKMDENVYAVTFGVGGGSLYAAATAEAIDAEVSLPLAAAQENVMAYWQEFLSQMKPMPSPLAEICENVGIMIKSQQAEDGAVLAGYNYHLAYVRDQYGTARGLLAMGFYREVEKLMYYYKAYYEEYGVIHNAQSIGHHGIFHIHENDNVEITGYLAVLCFYVYKASKNEAFMREMLPFVRWCIDSQVKELRNGMLPFNGDETYIAIGFLPRFALLDGSAEATMLLAESIRNYQEFTGDMQYSAVLEEIDSTFLKNFVRDGRLMANIPERMALEDYPAGRNGVCERCFDYIVPLFCNENGRYVCEKCRSIEPTMPPRDFGSMELSASKLAPLYTGSPLVPMEQMRVYLEEMVAAYKKDKQMPSGYPGGHAVGYDYGLFLYALTQIDHPFAKEIYDLSISVLDETGVWCEFYKNNVPYNTRCRPWESGINVEGLITYHEKMTEK